MSILLALTVSKLQIYSHCSPFGSDIHSLLGMTDCQLLHRRFHLRVSIVPIPDTQYHTTASSAMHRLRAVTMSRFILNLRVATSYGDNAASASTFTGVLPSSSIFGNIGAPIHITGDQDEEEDGL